MALSVVSAPWQQVDMPALDLRRYVMALTGSEGVRQSGDMLVSQRAAGANMSVDIAAGIALVQGDAVAYQGFYYALNDATYNLTGFTAADVTNPRIDRVVLRVRDAYHGDAANDVSFLILTGTPTSGATLANLSGAAAVGNSELLLANVLMPANATSVTTANIASVAPAIGPSSVALDYKETTTNVSFTTATSEATANTILTGNSVTYTGIPVVVEFEAQQITTASSSVITFVVLRDTTVVGQNKGGTFTSTGTYGYYFKISDTPPAGTHVYAIKAFSNAAFTMTINAGAGGSGNLGSAFMRVTAR